MAYTTEKAPNKKQTHEVVIKVKGPVDPAKWKAFKKTVQQAVWDVGGSIGPRGRVDKAGTFIKPKPR